MRKANLLLVIAFMLVLFSFPMVLGAQNSVTYVTGNETKLYFSLTTYQVTTNPTIGQDVTYRTEINVTGNAAKFNITYLTIALPDNHSTQTASDFRIITNSTSNVTGANFAIGNYNTINFTGNYTFLNQSGGIANATLINMTWKSSAPIGATKIGVSKSGRVYTETWNITSANSNLTIENASLVVTPTYWYSRIGAPTSVKFNATAVGTGNYTTNVSDIEVWANLDIGHNMLEYGSGYETLSITYNGPTVDQSTGDKPTAVSIIPTETAAKVRLALLLFFGLIVIIGTIVVFVTVQRKRR